MAVTRAPYGSWRSPVSAQDVAAGGVRLGGVALDGRDTYWIESRPAEAGRCAVVRLGPDGVPRDVTPPDMSVRTRAHEYGGGAFAVSEGTLVFSRFADQRLYRQDPGAAPEPITPPCPDGALRYADCLVDRARDRVVCVREDHTGPGEAVNTLVSVALDGSGVEVLASGHDFYSSPRLSPDGGRLAWLAWRHPNMPWDGTDLFVGGLSGDGSLAGARRVAGGPAESIFQPEWSPDGALYFISDAGGFWNPYRLRDGRAEALCPREAEFGVPQWAFGMSTYAVLPDATLLCAFTERGRWQLARLDPADGRLAPIDTPYTEIGSVRAAGGRAVFAAASPAQALRLVELDPDTHAETELRRFSSVEVDPGCVSLPEPIEFPTAGGQTAHALFYPPANRDFEAPEGERPPLVVRCHGGPTGAASTALSLRMQYFTSRGFAVLDVNYRGSSGYGRAYREQLDGRWGVADVEDCVAGAEHLAARGDVDRDRLAIAGSSAGGYTVLCALTFRDVFRAGASYYGISDLEALTRDTHKLESRYNDRLVGPYPERRDLYRERSPIHHADRLSCPVIFLQGLEDRVVPPDQAERMVEALRRKGLPVAYLAFEGEPHGFRRADTIRRAIEAELFFYARVLGFPLGEELPPVPIENL